MQAVPLGFMRGFVGVIGIGCAYMLGRSVVFLRQGRVRVSRVYAWAIRTLLCLLAVWYPARPDVDTSDLVVWSLAAIAFALAYWDASRVKKHEEVKLDIFPESEDKPTNSESREP
jgi:hypothetical protein